MSDLVMSTGRRARRRLLAAAAGIVALAVSATGLLPGPFDHAAGADPVPAGTPGVTRYFGRGAYDGIRAAVAATPRSCALGDDTLAALVMAPIFKEVSGATSPQTAPSPMTLSRWDEWTGVRSGSNNMNANYGLYPFADPATPYSRAYWTPGIGIFQYDSAGVGANFTAAELMDVQYIAGDVAAGMANRYCASGGDDYAKRAAAWQPWSGLGGVGKSEALFQEMLGLDAPAWSRIGLVDGIENGGGMQARTCVTGGQTLPCWYIDPSKAQGANWWALDDPTGGAAGSGEAPLPAPFYVVKQDGFEVRHFMAIDTGYPVNLSGRRQLGLNARPRDGQPGSGIVWLGTSDLCDTSRPEMGCAPPPPPPAPAPAPEPEPAATPPAEPDPATGPDAAAPAQRVTPATVEELLGTLLITPDGALGALAVF
ncbi:MAG TPA: hypothetical protein VH479_06570 [Acidimicrobiales bacterium]|jgi:hypothetical protein